MQKDLGVEIPELSYETVGRESSGPWTWDAQGVHDDMELVDAELVEPEPQLYAEAPPERVRFNAPVHLSLDDDLDGDNFCDGAILNLSQSGALVLVPLALQAGDRVHIRFRPSLAEEPLCVPAYVVWKRIHEQQNLCGLRFLNLALEDERRILATVQERATGRAGAWPLPVFPEPRREAKRASTKSPWFSGALGLVAGVTLALVASAIPRAGQTGHLELTSSPRPVASVAPVAGSAPLETKVGQEAAPAPALVSASPAEVPPAPVVALAPRPHAPAEPALEAEPAKPALASVTGKQAPALSRTDDGLTLALYVHGEPADVKSFWLANPRRLVIDVSNATSALGQSDYELNDAWALRLRSGNHADKVRFVIEANEDAGKTVSTRLDGSRVEVRFNR